MAPNGKPENKDRVVNMAQLSENPKLVFNSQKWHTADIDALRNVPIALDWRAS